MDVRCEKCLTVYDFDEAQVGPLGVTVKCTQCGNLFKVKRRETQEHPVMSAAQRQPAFIPPRDVTAPSRPPPSMSAQRPNVSQSHPSVSQSQPIDPNQWLVKLQLTGEVFKIYDLKMLKEWILERKLTREDLISKEGNVWKPLGGVPELGAIFRQAESQRISQPMPTPQPEEVPLSLATTAPMDRDEKSSPDTMGPSQMGMRPNTFNEPAFTAEREVTNPKPKLTPAALSIPPIVDELADLEEELPTQKSRAPMVVAILLLLVIGGLGAVAVTRPDLIKSLMGQKAPKSPKGYEQARAKFLMDSDEELRQSVALFQQAHGADEQNALVLAGLAEAQATRASYLREDARALDAQGAAVAVAAQTLRKEAQGLLDDAKREASDALALSPDAPEVNRAMADFLRIDGAPAAEVERYLSRALAKTPNDAEAVFVGGALAWRENKPDEAMPKLLQANQLSQASAGKQPLLRAELQIARIAIAQNKKDDARAALNAVLQANPQHDRAKALLATLDVAPALDAGVHAPDAAVAAAQLKPLKLPSDGTAPPPSDAEPVKGDYNSLVAQAEKLSEHGRADQARKLYERALAMRPSGVEAITGLGYCDLDKERFLAAVDRFKQALQVAPDYGDALIGLAESYQVRGDRPQAINYYRRYLRAQPNGPKAAMAQKNIRDLDAHEVSTHESDGTHTDTRLPPAPENTPSNEEQPPPPP
jgi:predicted Zn finger-like uncharacterized protein